MTVSEIHIRRFKSLIDLRLPLARVTVLTGPNNSGKSSVLQAVQFATSIAQTAKSFSPRLNAGTLASEQLVYSPLRDVEALAPNNQFTQLPASAITIEIRAEVQPGVVEPCTVTVRRGKNRNLAYSVTDNELGQTLASIDKPFSVLVTGLAGIARQEEFKSEGVVRKAAARGDANSVLRNVLWLLRQDQRAWADFQAHIAEVFPGIEIAVAFDAGLNDYINVAFKRHDNTLPLDAAGTGVLQAVQILSYVNVYKPKVLLIDEPDSHLHPNNQRALARLLVRLGPTADFQILATTHSRHMLDELSDDADVHWFSEGVVGTSQFNIAEALVDLGAIDSVDILTANTLVALTEDSDVTPMEAILQSVRTDGGSLVRSYGGAGNLESTKTVASFIWLHAPAMKIVVHRDRDYLADDDAQAIEHDLQRAGIYTFFPSGTDIESCFLSVDHVAELYPELDRQELEGLLLGARAAARSTSLAAMITARVSAEAKRTPGGFGRVNIGELSMAAEREFDANQARFLAGKRVLGHLVGALQMRLQRNVSLIRSSQALAMVPEVAALRRKLGE